MQSAETVLDVLRERGRRGLPCDELYRQLFNPQLYLVAYGPIYSNQGAMTPGADGETADGMTLGKIERIIDALRRERYRFKPVKRHYIPKKDGKQRALGLPSWSDKLLGEVIRLLLEAYYEPRFSEHSHGYRPGRGCHTALRHVAITWTGTTWFIEGDIARCFDELDHSVTLRTLGEKIHDSRLLRLIGQMLQAEPGEPKGSHRVRERARGNGSVTATAPLAYLTSVRQHAPAGDVCIDPTTSCSSPTRRWTRSAGAYWNELRSLGDPDAAKRFNEDTTQDPPRWFPGDGADRAGTAPVGGPPA